jgi:hypothetical protein
MISEGNEDDDLLVLLLAVESGGRTVMEKMRGCLIELVLWCALVVVEEVENDGERERDGSVKGVTASDLFVTNFFIT